MKYQKLSVYDVSFNKLFDVEEILQGRLNEFDPIILEVTHTSIMAKKPICKSLYIGMFFAFENMKNIDIVRPVLLDEFVVFVDIIY